MIDTIFFDLGNVLLHVNKDIAVNKIAKIINTDPESLYKQIDYKLEEEFETGLLSTDEYISILNSKFDREFFTKENLGKVWELVFEWIDSSWEILEKLKSQANIYMLSNTNALHISSIESRFKILNKFNGLVLSYEVKARKPDKKIYEIALKKAGTIASRSIFIDDLPENVAAAKKMGISSLLYKNSNELIDFLRLHNFKV